MVKEILLIGNPKLYEVSSAVEPHELDTIKNIIEDLHDTLMAFRQKYGAGRAIAAPQIGFQKRLIYMNIDQPVVMINPVLEFVGDEEMIVMDDCMSFPNLYVKVKRHKKCMLNFMDMNWQACTLILEDDLSELLQHEYDHLDGILATMRAIDNQSFFMK